MERFTNELVRSLFRLNKEILRIASRDAERHGLTVAQVLTLYTLASNPNMRLSELADTLTLTNSTVSGIVDRLVNQGLVSRVASSEDRRAIGLRLTEKGNGKLEELKASESALKQKIDIVEEKYGEDMKLALKFHRKLLEILTSEEE
ncbi:MarR family winged helix-turn-helix transcriptional regulator [Heyndrickxia acidiproducens]|uniref:MarR family winged helix-turn-helix transcriptional regulator n=1 Tax=Heyndrickxia acidiproducens TaxID=1121084 RepID=UPI00038276A9|nr:MarR family transcriptional regulator [Heyndrickxia acidiproducens]